MKFWNIIIIFAYICIYVKECSQAGMAYLSWLYLCRGLSPNLLRQTNSVYLNIVGL